MADTATLSLSKRSDRQRRRSMRESFSRETQHALTIRLLRSMLPDGWNCPPGKNRHGVQCEGLHLRTSPSSNNDGDDDGLQMIRANQSIKISKLIPIVNSTRSERQLDGKNGNNLQQSLTLAPPSLSRNSSVGTTISTDLDYVYYFEIFLMHGIFSLGFEADNGEEESENVQINRGPGMVPESIGLHVNGDLWIEGVRVPNWTQPFQNGDTIGCGILIGNKATYFFTRNGVEIESGTANCRVSSIQTALIPCVGVPTSCETVIRTNFGFHSEHPFFWKGNGSVRIICDVIPGSSSLLDDSNQLDAAFLPPNLVRGHTVSLDTRYPTSPVVCGEGQADYSGHDLVERGICHVIPGSSDLLDDSNQSDAAFLPPDLVRGHTVSLDTRYPTSPVVCREGQADSSGHDAGFVGQGLRRLSKHARRHSDFLHSSRTGEDQYFSHMLDLDADNDGYAFMGQRAVNINDFKGKVLNANGSNSMDALDLNDIKELARELRSATSDSDAHHGALSQLVGLCRSNLEQLNEIVQRATMGVESAHDLGDLLTVHELVTDAVQAAEKKSTESNDRSSQRDIFSLLCHLRGQKQKRHDAVWGLLRLTKRGYDKRCGEIVASGGMQSLLTLFKTSHHSSELMMVSALTVVYLLPSLLDSDVQSSSYIHLGVIECLQYLIQSSRESIDIDISLSEIRTASALTMANLWLQVLVPKLRSTEMDGAMIGIKRFGRSEHNRDPFSSRRFRRRSSLSSKNGEEVDIRILIDSFTSLSIMAANSEALMQNGEGSEKASALNVYYQFAVIVESICDVEFARPMAMKEGAISLLLNWLRSGDIELERPAANALRNLTLTQDDYVAGWVHCQLLNENALIDIVRQLESGDSQVRLAMAELISILTVAPHTRAGIIEARGVKYLVQLLGSVDVQSRDKALALAAGNALLRLAMGEASLVGAPVSAAYKTLSPSKKECIVDDIIQNGALDTLVSMASAEDYGDLRFLSAKLLRVISERCSGIERDGKEQDLCDAEAVSALGKILWDDISVIRSSVKKSLASSDTSDLINDSLSNEILTSAGAASCENALKEVRHVLRGLMNILHSASSTDCHKATSFFETQLSACSQLITSGGVKSLLWIAAMPQDACSKLDMIINEPAFCLDIQIDSCQTLASICPLLLLSMGQISGMTKWAPRVLSALVHYLKNQIIASRSNGDSLGLIPGVYVDVLQGLGCLADWEPLKTRIIDEFMPHLLELHRHENRSVSEAATRVCLALGFSEVESGANDAYLLGDKFNLTRSSLIQGMVRDEIRRLMIQIWMPAVKALVEPDENGATGNGCPIFSSLCHDDDTAEIREKVRQQFMNVYDCHPVSSSRRVRSSISLGGKAMQRTMHRSGSYIEHDDFGRSTNSARANSAGTSRNHLMEEINMHASSEFAGNNSDDTSKSCHDNFLQCHQYPLNGTMEERKWIIEHCQALLEGQSSNARFSPCLPGRVNDVLAVCFPSELIRDQIIPLCDFKPNASFDFRALTMPAGRYYSFRREGQLISQECESLHNSERVHYTLCFRNSCFAGEFTESLLQALYLFPIIQGLSFSNDAYGEGNACNICGTYEGSEELPLLTNAIPSSVTHLTFDNVLSDNAALSLAHILKSVQDEEGDEETLGSVKGSLRALAITNSPHINQSIFSSLVESIDGISSPLLFLRTLDLSGNLLGDICSAKILSIALSSSSSIAIQHLDLSRNGIREGSAVKRVLEECVSNDPKLQVLNLSQNDFGEGEVAFQLAASLGDVFAKLHRINLSGNDLSGTFLAALGGSLAYNSHLINLNISNNRYSSSSINSFLSRLHNMSNSNDSTLSSVHLEGNVPSLAPNQEMVLNEILSANRQRRVATYLNRQSDALSSPPDTDYDTNVQSSISDITGEPNAEQTLPPAEMIAVLFSAPLVWRDGENEYHPIEMLDFKLEKSLLWQCFTEASRNIDLTYDNATTDRLQAVMTRGFKCLHFSGHGHPYCLTFEDGSGGIHWFNVDQLKALISGGVEDGEPPFQFVFVSACHSALAGHTFVDCGVPHVVCCQQESQLMDRAALSFTRAFYLALAVGRTLKDSFEIGKHAVLSSATVLNPDEEMEKFMLLPEDGEHDVPIFNAEEVPEWPTPNKNGTMNSSKSDVNESLPTPPQGFLGRETDMYRVLNLVLTRRYVNIVGPVGMGRSSLAAALCHYIDERKSTLLFDDIYFVQSMQKRPVSGKSSPIISLHNQLVSTENEKAIHEYSDLDEVIQDILASLKQTKSLLVFDEIETLDGTTEAQDFHFFLGQIFGQTKDVHVLVTSDQSNGLSPLVSVGESVYNLGPLNFRNTMKLFAYHCPHLHSSRERKELVERFASHTVMNRLAEGDEASENMKSMLGGGIPAKTFAIAYEMTAEEFQEQLGEEKEK